MNDLFEQIYKEHPKLKPFDLSVIHIYNDHPKKPFMIHNDNILYYYEYHAIGEKGEILETVISRHIEEAKTSLQEKIKKGTVKYDKWIKNGSGIRYSPHSEGRYLYLKKRMTLDFPDISDVWKHWMHIFDEYDRIFERDFRKVYSFRTKALKFKRN